MVAFIIICLYNNVILYNTSYLGTSSPLFQPTKSLHPLQKHSCAELFTPKHILMSLLRNI